MLSILIPCFNESEILQQTFNTINDYLIDRKLKFEIIFINNGSTDNSIDILNNIEKENLNIVISNKEIQGKGLAIKEGLLLAKFNKIVILDADLSVGIDHLTDEILETQEILYIGSRSKGVEVGTPYMRRLAGKALNQILRRLFKISFKDTQCGFKFISSNNIKEIANNLSTEGFMYDLDLILSSTKYNLKVKEIPIQYNHNYNSSVSLLKDPAKMVLDIFKIYKKFSYGYFFK
tara:strand:+ start:121 stop:822 length:702 start_codon:yes stop_codon:yes gene_type:complete